MVSMVINATPVTFAKPLARPKTPWLGVNSQSKMLHRWHGSASSKAISHSFLSLFCAWLPPSPLFKTSMVQISVTFLWLLFKSISHTVILLTGPLPSLYVMLSFDSKSNSVYEKVSFWRINRRSIQRDVIDSAELPKYRQNMSRIGAHILVRWGLI